ncbi:MAG: hypothetical protein PWP24_561 [Clostridiales bacterium]|nr:hypothetical protein [Clostridiales bacterium]
MVSMTLPSKVEYILDVLMDKGFEAYAVGGCVRDTVLGRIPGDWDITTSARPEEVKDLFPRTLDTGIQHGTVTVMLDKEGFEVTTYRIDGVYEDSRHPKQVSFTSNLIEDLRRRDFTINAMAYNHKDGLVDAFEGLQDIEKKIIRCVGNPKERFEEDALRMLRAVRFAAQLGFSMEQNTKDAISRMAPSLVKISQERVRVELDKLLMAKSPKLLLEAAALGITKVVLPEFDAMQEQEQLNPHHIYSLGMHALASVTACNEYLETKGGWISKHTQIDKKLHSIFCWTLLLHDVGKPATHSADENGVDHFYGHVFLGADQSKKILSRLKFDNYTIDLAARLIKWHDYPLPIDERKLRRAASKIGPDIMEYLFFIKRMDIYAKNPDGIDANILQLEQVVELYDKIILQKNCLTIKELAINGKDIMRETNIPAGPRIGEILSCLLEQVLEEPEKNTKETLLNLIPKE